MNSSPRAISPRRDPAKTTAAANAPSTRLAFRRLSRCPPTIPMLPNAAQVRNATTGNQTARIPVAPRTIAAAESPASPVRTAGTIATIVSAF